MKTEDFMGQPANDEGIPTGVQPQMPDFGGTYVSAARAMGREAFMEAFPKTEDGKYMVPHDFIREVIQVAAIRLLGFMLENPTVKEEEVLPIAEGLHSVLDVVNGVKPSNPGELGAELTKHLQAVQDLLTKYGQVL